MSFLGSGKNAATRAAASRRAGAAFSKNKLARAGNWSDLDRDLVRVAQNDLTGAGEHCCRHHHRTARLLRALARGNDRKQVRWNSKRIADQFP